VLDYGEIVTSLRRAPNGDVLAAVRHQIGSASKVTGRVVRLKPTGSLDPTFGDGGRAKLAGDVRDVAQRADGRLVAVGQGSEPWGHGPAVYGLLADGRPDPSIGGGSGMQVTPMLQGGLYLHAGLLPDGKILAEGLLYGWDTHVVARYSYGSGGSPPEDSDRGDGGAGRRGGAVPPGIPGTPPRGATAAGVGARSAGEAAAFVLRAPPRLALRTLLRRGLRLTLGARRPGRAVVRLLRGRRVLARAVVTFRVAGQRHVTLRLTRAGRAALLRRGAPLRVTVDAGGRRVADRPVVVAR
jgi:hypothetical protein